MTRFNNKVTHSIIKKIHLLLADVKTGEELIDYLRSTEPVFMQEVGRFVTIELDKLKEEFEGDEEFLMYLGSVLGAAYIMGFLVAREMDHHLYKDLIDFDSIIKDLPADPNYIDKIIDKGLEAGKKPKEIGKILHDYIKGGKIEKKSKKTSKKPTASKRKKKKPKRLDINLNEEDL